jgi:hypothetical protein
MPSNFDIAKGVAQLVYDAWAVVNKDSAAKNGFMLFCSLLRLDNAEIEPGHNKVTLRAASPSGMILESSGPTLHEAFQRLMGKI